MIKVLKSGFYTTIQDKGRVGFASLGVPISGAMDSYSSDLANRILNNSLDCALLEITLGGCKLQFLSKTTMCISGGDFSPTINNQPILLNSKISIQENDILSFGKVNFGVRCYLAVKGGIQSDIKLGSRSSFKNITRNFLLKSGDYLPISNLKVDL
jgi:allophanate hydrolase subunit 2